MDYRISLATPDDAPEILALTKICGGETDNLSYGSRGLPLTVEAERQFLESVMQSEKDVFYVARVGEEIVGTANYSTFTGERMAHRGQVALSVRKSAWGKGIGHAFIEKLLDFARNQAKVEIVSLEVRSDNERAVKLYQDFGFRRTGTFEGYFKIDGKLVDFDIMELKLEKPQIAESASIVKESVITGDVTVGEESCILFYAVLRGDDNRIVIGRGTNIQDNCTVHTSLDFPTVVGDYVTVGHNAILHGCRIGDNSLIGMGSVVMDGTEIGKNCLVAAGSLVLKNQKIPDNSLVMGNPAKVKRMLTPEEVEGLKESARAYIQTGKELRQQGMCR